MSTQNISRVCEEISSSRATLFREKHSSDLANEARNERSWDKTNECLFRANRKKLDEPIAISDTGTCQRVFRGARDSAAKSSEETTMRDLSELFARPHVYLEKLVVGRTFGRITPKT